jgi:hypothetical protein
LRNGQPDRLARRLNSGSDMPQGSRRKMSPCLR